MPRLIDADALLEKAWDADTSIGYVQVVDVGEVLDAPTISADEVRGRGKWTLSKDYPGYAMCSCCEDAFVDPEWILRDGKWNYCPNCGAHMEGGDA